MPDTQTIPTTWNDVLLAFSLPFHRHGHHSITSPPPPDFPDLDTLFHLRPMNRLDTRFMRSLPEFEHWHDSQFGYVAFCLDMRLLRDDEMSLPELFMRGPVKLQWYEVRNDRERSRKMTMHKEKQSRCTKVASAEKLDEIDRKEELHWKALRTSKSKPTPQDAPAQSHRPIRGQHTSLPHEKSGAAPAQSASPSHAIHPNTLPDIKSHITSLTEALASKILTSIFNGETTINSHQCESHVAGLTRSKRAASPYHQASVKHLEARLHAAALQIRKAETARLEREGVFHTKGMTFSRDPRNFDIERAAEEYACLLLDADKMVNHHRSGGLIESLTEEILKVYPELGDEDIEEVLREDAMLIRKDPDVHVKAEKLNAEKLNERDAVCTFPSSMPNYRERSQETRVENEGEVRAARISKRAEDDIGAQMKHQRDAWDARLEAKSFNDAETKQCRSPSFTAVSDAPNEDLLTHPLNECTEGSTGTKHDCFECIFEQSSEAQGKTRIECLHAEPKGERDGKNVDLGPPDIAFTLPRPPHHPPVSREPSITTSSCFTDRSSTPSDTETVAFNLEQLRYQADDLERLASKLRAEYEEAKRAEIE